MGQSDAIALIQKPITSAQPQRWFDPGYGIGTCAVALNSILPAESYINAVDKQT